MEKLHKTGISPIKTLDITGSLKGRSNIISRLRELIQNTKKELIISTSALDFEDKSRVLLPAIQQAARNNVKVKMAIFGNSDKLKKINIKSNLKIIPSTSNARLFISDRKEILFMITPENSDEDLAVWLNSPFFAQALSELVESDSGKKSDLILSI